MARPNPGGHDERHRREQRDLDAEPQAGDRRHEAGGRDPPRLRRRSGEALLRGPRLAAGPRPPPPRRRPRRDAAASAGDAVRGVQFTPPHSQCSIHFGKGLTAAEPGSADRLLLAVEDIDAVRADLIRRGVEVSEVYESRPPGFESIEGRSYFTYASFSDPDGNGWLLQEVTTRLPGREWDD